MPLLLKIISAKSVPFFRLQDMSKKKNPPPQPGNSHAALKVQFLSLPLRERSPTGLVRADVYISVRELKLEVATGPRPLIANWINPYAAFVYPPFPVIQNEPNAKSAYPNLVNAFYECFITLKDDKGESIAHRPAVIMVDDPVLQFYFLEDLRGTGTDVRVVNQNTEVLTADDGKKFNLVAPADHCWLNFRRGIIEFMKQQEVKKAAAVAEARARGEDVPETDNEPPASSINPDVVPAVLTACMNCGCFRTHLQACGKCLSAFYCSRDCQVAGWKRHKRLCKKADETLSNNINSEPSSSKKA